MEDDMLIVLNGYPGVGKLTIGRELAELTGGRLLDAHTIYNVAFALTEFKSDAFYETIRSVWAVTDPRIVALPKNVPVILTEVLTGTSDWANESWVRILDLARDRGPLFVVHISCDLEENKRRIQSAERDLKRKPRDPEMAERYHAGGAQLVGSETPNFLALNVTSLSAASAAQAIKDWVDRE